MLNNNDRKWLEKIQALRDLKNHPAWSVYQEEVLDATICNLRDLLLNGINSSTSPAEEVMILRGVRFALKAFVRLRERPEEMLDTAQRVRDEFGVPTAEEVD